MIALVLTGAETWEVLPSLTIIADLRALPHSTSRLS